MKRSAEVVKKPSRRDLLVVIGRLQDLIGKAMAADHDRNPHRKAQVDHALERAHRLCVQVRSFDPPLKDSGSWAIDDGPDDAI